MTNKSEVKKSSPRARAGRRIFLDRLVLAMLMPVAACGRGRMMQKEIVLNVVMYSNLARPIHDIIFNATDLGVANKYGGTGTITGVRIPFGKQTLRWNLGGPDGMDQNGERVNVKNDIVITPDQIPPGTRYIGLHLYPDDTAEVTFAEFIPERSERGKKIRANRTGMKSLTTAGSLPALQV